MFTITDSNGVNLVDAPPAARTLTAAVPGGATCMVAATLTENDPALPYAFVTGTLHWDDGSVPVVYSGTGTLSISATRSLFPGDYIISLLAQNYRAPAPDREEVNYPVHVAASGAQAPALSIVFGPILPRDTGAPNPDQWDFDIGTDLRVLESSVKMLLITAKGERVMQPEYGTNLRNILFEANISGIEAMVQQEIVDAITTWEPRVTLLSIDVTRKPDRSVVVDAVFISKLNQQNFTTSLVYQP